MRFMLHSYRITSSILVIHWLICSALVIQYKAQQNTKQAFRSEESVYYKLPFYKSIIILKSKHVNKEIISR